MRAFVSQEGLQLAELERKLSPRYRATGEQKVFDLWQETTYRNRIAQRRTDPELCYISHVHKRHSKRH
jgi:DNA-binding transcriptional regulator/RsmH inhibitor MraZ